MISSLGTTPGACPSHLHQPLEDRMRRGRACILRRSQLLVVRPPELDMFLCSGLGSSHGGHRAEEYQEGRRPCLHTTRLRFLHEETPLWA